MTLSGYTGTIVKWQKRLNAAATWTDIANTSATYEEVPSAAGSWEYRAVTNSGTDQFSAPENVFVDPASVGGTVSGGSAICSGNTSDVLTLSGYTGTIVKWQSSVSPFSTWTDIANTGNTYTSGLLTQTTQFRAVIQSGSCSSASSSVTTVSVNPLPDAAGPISGPATFTGGSAGITYTVASIANATSYVWAYTGNGVTINGTGNTVTLDFSVSATSGQLQVKGRNGCGDGAASVLDLSPGTHTLVITSVMLEGLYNGAATMRQARNASGPQWPAGVADHISVELHSATSYSTIIYTATDVPLSTAGTASVSVPAGYNGSYYITIRHRNSLPTVSATAKSFFGTTVTQAFHVPADVYGGNLIRMIDGEYAIFAGDVNQDNLIDLSDLVPVGNQAANAAGGYIVQDVNGDGLVDLSDLIIVGNSAALAIGAILPR
jgi:hypothetical protein